MPGLGKDYARNNNLERDDDSKRNHPALRLRFRLPQRQWTGQASLRREARSKSRDIEDCSLSADWSANARIAALRRGSCPEFFARGLAKVSQGIDAYSALDQIMQLAHRLVRSEIGVDRC